jgi:putative addiction module component (TIGR02574 family)
VHAQEAVCENTTAKVGPKFLLDEAVGWLVSRSRVGQEGLELLADDPVQERRLLGRSRRVAFCRFPEDRGMGVGLGVARVGAAGAGHRARTDAIGVPCLGAPHSLLTTLRVLRFTDGASLGFTGSVGAYKLRDLPDRLTQRTSCPSIHRTRHSASMSNALMEQLRRLSLAERLQLVEDLWVTIAAEAASLPVPASHRQQLALRRAAHRANPSDVIPWEEVRRQFWAEE